ncbi:hypothetical protein ACWDEM_31990, partial [Streptomyces sp. NPDC001054]
ARWHEYEAATKGRRAIEWTRYLRQMLGLDGGDTEADDLDLLAAGDAEGGELRAGVRITERGWTGVTTGALDLAVVQAAEGTDGNTDPGAMAARVRDVLVLADVAGQLDVLGSLAVAEAYESMLAALALRREAAIERRRAETAERDQERPELSADALAERLRRLHAAPETDPSSH